MKTIYMSVKGWSTKDQKILVTIQKPKRKAKRMAFDSLADAVKFRDDLSKTLAAARAWLRRHP